MSFAQVGLGAHIHKPYAIEFEVWAFIPLSKLSNLKKPTKHSINCIDLDKLLKKVDYATLASSTNNIQEQLICPSCKRFVLMLFLP
jgi:hypothetical protein